MYTFSKLAKCMMVVAVMIMMAACNTPTTANVPTHYNQVHGNPKCEYGPEAVETIYYLAQRGNAQAEHTLGHILTDDHCILPEALSSQTYNDGMEWYAKAAKQNFTPAMLALAVKARDAGNTNSAIKWLEKAADRNDALGQALLGSTYLIGDGVPKDYSKALYWLRKSAGQGNDAAQHSLGSIYFYGTGMKKDYGNALKYYKLSAGQGNKNSNFMLGIIYDKGLEVKQDTRLACSYYQKAYNSGFNDAAIMVRNCRAENLL